MENGTVCGSGCCCCTCGPAVASPSTSWPSRDRRRTCHAFISSRDEASMEAGAVQSAGRRQAGPNMFRPCAGASRHRPAQTAVSAGQREEQAPVGCRDVEGPQRGGRQCGRAGKIRGPVAGGTPGGDRGTDAGVVDDPGDVRRGGRQAVEAQVQGGSVGALLVTSCRDTRDMSAGRAAYDASSSRQAAQPVTCAWSSARSAGSNAPRT